MQDRLPANWAALIASGALALGPVSARTHLDADDTALTGYYLRDETLRIAALHASLLAAFAAGALPADAVTVDARIAIVSETPGAREIDTRVLRPDTDLGALLAIDTGEMMPTEALAFPWHDREVRIDATADTPLEVAVCRMQDHEMVTLPAVRAVEIDPSDTPEDLADLLDVEEDERRARLVCYLHEGARMRSTTITREAETAEGPVRSVVYSHIET